MIEYSWCIALEKSLVSAEQRSTMSVQSRHLVDRIQDESIWL
ncbi:hypothetical protein [Tabrizicola sp.]|nr:hypothetical protein [Tabrizicola sp.]MDM7933637.1 hypothetical protein [Tabrizicola sp.]